MMKRSLLLGCGNSRVKKIATVDKPDWIGELTTMDMDKNCNPSIAWDFNKSHFMPFDDNTFDELAAYDSLEHWCKQGDWKGYFDEFSEYHRILKPGGEFGIIVPIGQDAFADPGHVRFFHKNHFGFLNQQFYEDNLKAGNPVTDYRWYYKKDFEIIFMEQYGDHHLAVVLRKPL
jgi:hypothetical protein